VLFSVEAWNTTDLERLTQLWRRRTQAQVVTDYSVGPDDVITISVPAMDEIQDRLVCV
jgi:hypothetical protein